MMNKNTKKAIVLLIAQSMTLTLKVRTLIQGSGLYSVKQCKYFKCEKPYVCV